jgi:hypothetical protein
MGRYESMFPRSSFGRLEMSDDAKDVDGESIPSSKIVVVGQLS